MENLFLTMLNISLTTSVVIIAVILLGSLINKHYVAKWKYCLWIVLALRLLIPFNYKLSDIQFQIQIPAKAGNMEVSDILGAGYLDEEKEFVGLQAGAVLYTNPQIADMPTVEPDSRGKLQSVTLLQALGYLWAAGAICLLLWQLTSFFCYKRRILKRGRVVEDPILLVQLQELSKELGIRKKITFMIYEKADSPMVVGFWNPILVIPSEEYGLNESFYILRHELIHLRRNDVFVKFLLLLARDFHWFNPVAYLMHREAMIDMELACDEAVVRGSSLVQKEAYTETLMSTLNRRQYKASLLSTQFSGGKRVMKKRFQNILTKVKKKNGIILFALITFLTVTVGMLTSLVVEATTVDKVEEVPDLSATISEDEDINTGTTREPTTVLTLIKEGMEEEVPATLYIGNGYSFYLIDDQWVMTEPGSWYAQDNESVRFWIDKYEGLNLNQVEEMLAEQGYSLGEGESSGRLYKYEEDTDTVNRVFCYETENDVWTMNSVHSLEGGEGWAVNIRAMFQTFAVTGEYTGSPYDAELINTVIQDNGHNIYTGTLDNKDVRMLITRTGDSLYAEYTTRTGEGKAFRGNLSSDGSGFTLNSDDGDYLNGTVTKADDHYFIIGYGLISQNSVTFTLYPEAFLVMGNDIENYYDFFGCDSKEAEQFAQQIKDSIHDRTAFAGLIQYPIYIEIDGSQIMVENEQSMINIYDQLMEQNGFQLQIENTFTKYMFANYYGICIDQGIIWFSKVSPDDYKITAINPPQYSPIQSIEPSGDIDQELENLMISFYTAYFNKDIDTIEQYLAKDYYGDMSVVRSGINGLEEIEVLGIKGLKDTINKSNIGDVCELSLEFRFPDEDSYTYLMVGFIKEDSGWKITGYGLEK